MKKILIIGLLTLISFSAFALTNCVTDSGGYILCSKVQGGYAALNAGGYPVCQGGCEVASTSMCQDAVTSQCEQKR